MQYLEIKKYIVSLKSFKIVNTLKKDFKGVLM